MGCKIALVDSGIDEKIYQNNIINIIDFLEDNTNENIICNDINSHGTLCCSSILSINPNVEILIIKVLNSLNRCSSKTLINVLDYLRDIDVNIINLSLSTSNTNFTNSYKSVIKDLNRKNKLIISSGSNNHSLSLPATLNGVIGIEGNFFINQEHFWYNKNLKLQCVADKKPVMLKSIKGNYELFGGNSKATAIFTGIVSKYLDLYKNNFEKFIMQKSQKKLWKNIENETPIIPDIILDKDILKYLEQIIIDIFKIPKKEVELIHKKELYKLGLTKLNAIELIKDIENNFNIDINYNNVDIYWFYSIKNLYYRVFCSK